MENKVERLEAGPKCPKCGEINNVWMFRSPQEGVLYPYTCQGCGVQYHWQMFEWRKFEATL